MGTNTNKKQPKNLPTSTNPYPTFSNMGSASRFHVRLFFPKCPWSWVVHLTTLICTYHFCHGVVMAAPESWGDKCHQISKSIFNPRKTGWSGYSGIPMCSHAFSTGIEWFRSSIDLRLHRPGCSLLAGCPAGITDATWPGCKTSSYP